MQKSTASRAVYSIVFLLVAIAGGSSNADLITIKPIHVDDGNGNLGNASQQLYLAESNKIWAQANITFNYLPFTTIISPEFYILNDQAEVDSLFSTAPGASSTPGVITMWFVKDHFSAYGEANELGGLNANKIVVTDRVFSEGRLDTIAHEIGHLLGLDHEDVDPGVETDYLMRGGEDRITPSTIDNIFPSGAGLDKLTAAQIQTARSDPKVSAVPEPSSCLVAIGLIVVCASVRRRKHH